MLINCPKCGFAQPKDQYCARCGVDMVAFRPPEKPVLKKLGESLAFQIFSICVLVVGMLIFIKFDHRGSVWSRIRSLGGSTQFAKSGNSHNFSTNQEAETVSSPAEIAAMPPTPSLPTSQDQKLSQTKIYYLEIKTQLLAKWLEEGLLTRVETVDGVTIAYLSQFLKLLETSPTEIKVLKEEVFPYALNQLHTAKLTSPNPRNLAQDNSPASPLIAYATLDEERPNEISGQLEMSVSPQASFPVQFNMPLESSFFIVGFEKAKSPDVEHVVVLKVSK